ncbi:hypothetical protein L249_4887 [Ophiocordyceps polyrhachis-furcata BCC 54312]|uniref:Protection of telomeres protein 1 n=1 Tax=Ophiocordyceps polyrhachis-furcata BCC 54312 TaxID=1330021 RepID=A0A367L2F7_9HYPO|nr:hypothetical protein L249_4887 [Ophiocordyceps polyrhachis-furcata BCC 54312]
MSLPSRYVSGRDILDGKRIKGTKANVVGLLLDVRDPIPTKGSDWKCEYRLYDKSLEDGVDSLALTIFRPKDKMPADANLGDVIAVFGAKVQCRYGDMSLISNHTTVLHIYDHSKIPEPPLDALIALQPSIMRATRAPTPEEALFVSVLYKTINRNRLPSRADFEAQKAQSVNIKNKFSELKNVREGVYVDVLVQIVKAPYDEYDKCSVWVSDYTENDLFYNIAFSGQESGETRPYGKRSMQITCFEPHASFLRNEQLPVGSWIYVRNLHIRLGRNGSNLEGTLHGDEKNLAKVNIEPVVVNQESASNNPQLKAALRRKLYYGKDKKAQLREIDEAVESGQKRKAQTEQSTVQKPNRQRRRKIEREKKLKETEQEDVLDALPNLNKQVKCENTNKAVSSLSQIMQPVFYETTIDDQLVKLRLPFVNANYRTVVRVINFEPSQLERFARPRPRSDTDMLPDMDQVSDSSNSEQDEEEEEDANTVWEWHFALELEEVINDDAQKPPKTMWVLVDNHAGQCLLNMDAADLSRDSQLLQDVRQRLSILWGERGDAKVRAQPARFLQYCNAPPSSDTSPVLEQASPLPFSCCLRQYAVTVAEPDAQKADAGDGTRWRRVFGLFGTRIVPT